MIKYLSLLALLLFQSSLLMAQVDETEESAPEPAELEKIEISTGPDGVKVQVQTIDSVTGNVKDTTKIKMKNSTIYIVNEENEETDFDDDHDDDWNQKHDLTNWLGIDLGMNGFLTPNDDIDFDADNEFMEPDLAQSRTFAINFWEEKLRIANDYVGIMTGLGIEWNSYRFKENYSLVTGNDSIFGIQGILVDGVLDSTRTFDKNKLRTTWVNVPLMLEFNTSLERKRSLHLAGGVIGGLRVGSMTKQRYKESGERYQIRTRNDFELAPYRLQAAVRVGYGSLNLFATYQLTELFEEGHGPELYPFTVGLTLLAFD